MPRFCKCIGCNRIKELISGKLCELCVKEVENSFIYGIGGKEVTKRHYDAIIKRGYVIPEELEDIRDEKE